ncbi:hypothetical protein GCM10010411_59670 [Actinomadura fulvescens]|uniref:Secreted protein n=2 Tax=Actinomadura fulvescens TaxID=46160 RepID=A0ABP6CEA3_9ACTN
MAVSASGAACTAIAAGVLATSAISGDGGQRNHVAGTSVAATTQTLEQNATLSAAAAKKSCTLRTWRPALSGKGKKAKVVGYGSISCKKRQYIFFEVMLCKHKALGAWSCTRHSKQSKYVAKKKGTHFQFKVSIPCSKAPGWETYRTEAVHNYQLGDMRRSQSEAARLYCPS